MPATELKVEVNESEGYVDVIGVVPETRFLIGNLQLQARYRFRAGSAKIEVFDEVKNRSDQPATMQLLYHINVGNPILAKDTQIVAAAEGVTARDARAAEGLVDWERCLGPTTGYAEQVYFLSPVSKNGMSEAALINRTDELVFSVVYKTDTLPCLTIWKNTSTESDGYVVGIEPATGYPNPRSVEEESGRLVVLGPGEAKEFYVAIEPASGSEAVQRVLSRVRS